MPAALQVITAVCSVLAVAVAGWFALLKDKPKNEADAAGRSVDAALSALNTALDRSGQTADAALHEVEELRVQLALARSEVSNLEQRVAELRREMYQMERQVADRDALIIARDREIAILRGVA